MNPKLLERLAKLWFDMEWNGQRRWADQTEEGKQEVRARVLIMHEDGSPGDPSMGDAAVRVALSLIGFPEILHAATEEEQALRTERGRSDPATIDIMRPDAHGTSIFSTFQVEPGSWRYVLLTSSTSYEVRTSHDVWVRQSAEPEPPAEGAMILPGRTRTYFYCAGRQDCVLSVERPPA